MGFKIDTQIPDYMGDKTKEIEELKEIVAYDFELLDQKSDSRYIELTTSTDEALITYFTVSFDGKVYTDSSTAGVTHSILYRLSRAFLSFFATERHYH